MTAIGSLRSIVLECSDPAPVAEFWAAVLGQEIVQRDDDWWSLAPGQDGSRLAFQVVPDHEAPAWPGAHGEQQIHLDIQVDDLPSSAERVVSLGARRLTDVVVPRQREVPPPGDEQWQVFADPAGHPFCLVT
jgi:catechol 2,3-dioxygenase-like lactoylglutathione lyase family enzyme